MNKKPFKEIVESIKTSIVQKAESECNGLIIENES